MARNSEERARKKGRESIMDVQGSRDSSTEDETLKRDVSSHGDDPLPSEEEEGPDDVLLEKGRVDALEQMRTEKSAVKSIKFSTKEKRRLKAELFKNQKDTKRLKLLSQFPEVELNKVFSIDEKKETKKEQSKKVVKRRLQTTPIAEQIGSVKIVLSGDAASHGGDEEGVNHAYERAQNFLKEQLFGDRHKRVPVLTQLAKKYRDKPALNFINSAR